MSLSLDLRPLLLACLPLAALAPLGGCAVDTDEVGASEDEVTSKTTQQRLDAAVAANESRMVKARKDPHYRAKFGSEPYLKLHRADEAVKGTVVVFHGFSGMPVQQNPLVDYLFAQGYDVFNASVAGHYLVNEPGAPRQFLGSKKLIEGGLTPLDNTFVAWPYADYGRDPVKEYTAEIDATYKIMSTLRKPFYAAGLSAGATQAIGIGARYPAEFKRVAALAPLLDLEPQKKSQLTSAAALIKTARITNGGEWDGWFAWDKTNPFPQGSFWGLQKYGSSLVPTAGAFKSNKQQLFVVTTDNEDAADSSKSAAFVAAAGGAAAGHVLFNYPKTYRVPHPINILDARSQGMVNFYYKTLFQETVRFFNDGKVKVDRLGKQDLAKSDRGSALPGYTEPSAMDWELGYFGGPERAFPEHRDLAAVP